MQRQNNNIAPGALGREYKSLPLTRELNLDTQLSDISAEVIRESGEVTPVLDSRRKEAMFIGVCTCKGCLKYQRVPVSVASMVICRNFGSTFQTLKSKMSMLSFLLF